MKKEDVLDLILKAVAVYLFVLAVVVLPGVVGAVLHIALLAGSVLETLTGDATLGRTLMSTGITTSVTGVLKFILYIIVARNLFCGGSWLRRILGAAPITQPDAQADGDDTAA